MQTVITVIVMMSRDEENETNIKADMKMCAYLKYVNNVITTLCKRLSYPVTHM